MSPDGCSPYNAAAVAHNRSVTGAGAGDSRKIVVCSTGLRRPIFSSVCCPEDDIKTAANHPVICSVCRNQDAAQGEFLSVYWSSRTGVFPLGLDEVTAVPMAMAPE